MKIPIKDIKYTVINNEKYKAVRCTGTVNMYSVLIRNIKQSDCYDISHIALSHKIAAVFSVQGWAKCSKEDKFNETTGKRIAESKMLLNAYNKIKKFLERTIKNTDDLVGKLEDFKYDLIQKRIVVEENHLERLKNGN